MVTDLIHLGPKYTVLNLEIKVNLKSQDRFICKLSKYFTHNMHKTNIEVHDVRKKFNVHVFFLTLVPHRWPKFLNYDISIFTLHF